MSEEESQKEASTEVPQKSPQEPPLEKVTEVLQIKSAPCPVPPEHIKVFAECCGKYEKGEMTDTEVMEKVRSTLDGLKKEETE